MNEHGASVDVMFAGSGDAFGSGAAFKLLSAFRTPTDAYSSTAVRRL
jgi:hypothetical protein